MSNVTELPLAEEEPRPQLRIPSFENLDVDSHRLSFSGTIEVDDQALLDRLRLNGSVELVVAGVVLRTGHHVKRDGDGYYEGTERSSTLKIDTVALVSDDEPDAS